MTTKWFSKPWQTYALYFCIALAFGLWTVFVFHQGMDAGNDYPSSVWIGCNPYTLEKLNQTECTATIGIGNQTVHINSTYDINIYK